jgi:cation transport protein ChaC
MTPELDGWNAELGIWSNAKASPGPGGGSTSSVQDFQLPSPLYVFGYGSLLWRPGDLLESFRSYRCSCLGYTRLFAQRSCDHRGTPSMPGVVVTLVENNELNGIISRSEYGASSTAVATVEFDRSIVSDECPGLIWSVPDERAQSLIDELDYREKGGYSKVRILVKLHEDTDHYRYGDMVTALVYIGSTLNPLFDLSLHQRIHDSSIRGRVVDVIATAVGPSGPNWEYLFGLEAFLLENRLHDSYIFRLAANVRRQLGAWRGWDRITRHAQTGSRFDAGPDVADTVTREIPRLMGWGSNENGQLKVPVLVEPRSDHETQQQHRRPEVELLLVAQELPYLVDEIFEHLSLEFQLICGGSYSAVLSSSGILKIWGVNVRSLVKPEFVRHDCSQVFVTWQQHTAEDVVYFYNVRNCSIGYDCVLILFECERVLGLGNDEYQLCTSRDRPLHFLVDDRQQSLLIDARLMFSLDLPPSDDPDVCGPIVKVVASVRHCAAIFETSLFIWGHPKYVQLEGAGGSGVYSNDSGFMVVRWKAAPEIRLIDVACGHKHTLALDSQGRLRSYGSSKFGALGLTAHGGAAEVDGQYGGDTVDLPFGIRWNKVLNNDARLFIIFSSLRACL